MSNTNKETGKNILQRIRSFGRFSIAIVGSFVATLGAFLPWHSDCTKNIIADVSRCASWNGLSNDETLFGLIVVFLSLGFALYTYIYFRNKKSLPFRFSPDVIGIISSAIIIFIVALRILAYKQLDSSLSSYHVGLGLYLSLVGSLMILFGSTKYFDIIIKKLIFSNKTVEASEKSKSDSNDSVFFP